jgi:uncharacterized membrane protein YfcA
MATSIGSIVRATESALDAVTESFSPSPGANSKTVRINGLVCVLVGVVCFALCGVCIAFFRTAPQVALLPSLLGYAFIAVGGYRVIRGKEPKAQYSAEVSWPRVFLGMFSVIFCFALFIGMVFTLEWALK